MQHKAKEGAIYTQKRQPVRLVFAEFFERIDEAFAIEKKIQGWSRAKKQALIRGQLHLLPSLSNNRQE